MIGNFRSFGDSVAWALGLAACCCAAQGFANSTPMRTVPVLPLGYPESPFVLRFTASELEMQHRWSDRVDAVVISRDAAPAIRTGADALLATLRRLGLGPAALVELDANVPDLSETLRGKHFIVLGTPKSCPFTAELCARGDWR